MAPFTIGLVRNFGKRKHTVFCFYTCKYTTIVEQLAYHWSIAKEFFIYTLKKNVFTTTCLNAAAWWKSCCRLCRRQSVKSSVIFYRHSLYIHVFLCDMILLVNVMASHYPNVLPKVENVEYIFINMDLIKLVLTVFHSTFRLKLQKWDENLILVIHLHYYLAIISLLSR